MKALKTFQVSQAGFTLMELLISITIILTIIAITGSAFKLAYNSVEKGEKEIQKQRQFSIAINYISNQLNAMCLKKACLFEGTRMSIKFHSFTSNAVMDDQNIIEVEYRAVKNNDEKTILKVKQEEGFQLTEPKQKEEFIDLISGIDEFSIEYLKTKSSEENIWVDEWKNPNHFPLAVKIKFRYFDRPVEIFSRILKTDKNKYEQ